MRKIALMGGKPAFDCIIPVGQLYFPDWEHYTNMMKGIFERKYYTNHGPLVSELESKLEKICNVKNVICTTNATIALMMAIEALSLEKKKIITPSFSFPATTEAILWCRARPVLCDIDIGTHHLSMQSLRDILENDHISAILPVNLWGGACNLDMISNLALEYDVPLVFDSAQAFACEYKEINMANFGAMSIFSFHATKVCSAAEGGCISTNDDYLAEKLRNIRSSYGVRSSFPVEKTTNGRMSEAQAGIALLSLNRLTENIQRNIAIFNRYQLNLSTVSGISVVHPALVSFSNYQYLVCEINEAIFGLTRDALLSALSAENIAARRYFYPGLHRSKPFASYANIELSATDSLCKKIIQLPTGALVSDQDVDLICEIIIDIKKNSEKINSYLKANLCE